MSYVYSVSLVIESTKPDDAQLFVEPPLVRTVSFSRAVEAAEAIADAMVILTETFGASDDAVA